MTRARPFFLFLSSLIWCFCIIGSTHSGDVESQKIEEKISRLEQLILKPGSEEFRQLQEDLAVQREEMTPAQQMRWRNLYAQYLFNLGRLDEAEQLNAINLQTATDPKIRSLAMAFEIIILTTKNDFLNAFRRLPAAVEAAEKTQDPVRILTAYNMRLLAYLGARLVEPTLEAADDLYRVAVRENEVIFGCIAMANKGVILQEERRVEEAMASLRLADELCAEIGSPLWRGVALQSMAVLELDVGVSPEPISKAEALLREALAADGVEAGAFVGARLYASLSETLRRQDKLNQAQDYAQKALDLAPGGLDFGGRLALRSAYRVARDQGRLEDALALSEQYFKSQRSYTDLTVARQAAFQQVATEAALKDQQISELSFQNTRLLQNAEISRLRSLLLLCAILLCITIAVFMAMILRRENRKKTEFQNLAQTDDLTGVSNRRHFLHRLRQAAKSSRSHERPMGLLFLDLDHFKAINDQHGHDVGDKVLVTVAKILHATLRADDAIGRLGGEEFAILLPGADVEFTRDVAERCRAAIATDPAWAGLGIGSVTASFGGTTLSSSETSEDVTELLRKADLALYRSKDAGRNQFTMFEDLAPQSVTVPA